jgi:phenylalanine-4-hydroxylase
MFGNMGGDAKNAWGDGGDALELW